MTNSSSTPPRSVSVAIQQRLLGAAVSGNSAEMKHMALRAPGVLLGTTPQGNTCLHIACIYGHERFCRDVLALTTNSQQSPAAAPLLVTINADGETPLLAAVASGHVSVALFILGRCREERLSEAILTQDKRGFNALHHAIRNGHRGLALQLVDAEPGLSKAVNKHDESPLFIAVMRNYADVAEKLLEIPDSAHVGAYGYNALHAAVRSGNPGEDRRRDMHMLLFLLFFIYNINIKECVMILYAKNLTMHASYMPCHDLLSVVAKRIMETRPELARQEDKHKATPMHMAVHWDKIDVLRVLLEHDWSLGYVLDSSGIPILASVASRGYVGAAQELLRHCPDAPYAPTNGLLTCLHQAVQGGHMELLEFFLRSKHLRKLVNMRDGAEETPLHDAVRKCNPKIVNALLQHPDTDVTVLNRSGNPATWLLRGDHAKTLNWVRLFIFYSGGIFFS